jgi:hypothetical protein
MGKAKCTNGNVLIRLGTKNKDKYNLTEDIQIELEHGYNFNLREDRPNLAEVMDGLGLTIGTKILVNYLALEKTYEIEGNDLLTKEEIAEGYKAYSVPEDMCFAYFKDGEWLPCKDIFLTLRVYKPYKGKLEGIEPQLVKNRMYCTKGEYAGKVLVTTLNCDYQIEWHNENNREEKLIRTLEREIMAIDEGMGKDLKKGKYLIGYSESDAKTLN